MGRAQSGAEVAHRLDFDMSLERPPIPLKGKSEEIALFAPAAAAASAAQPAASS